MENKAAKVLLALALGTVVVYIVFKTQQAQAAEPKTIPKVPVIPEQPKWQITADTVCYRSGNLDYCIQNPLGGLFKKTDQVAKDALEAVTQITTK